MLYSESGPDSNFAINSASKFDSFSQSNSVSESDFNSVFMNLGICIFLFYICIFPKRLSDGLFLSILITESIVMQAMLMHTLFGHIITQKFCLYHTIKFSHFSFQVFLFINRFA